MRRPRAQIASTEPGFSDPHIARHTRMFAYRILRVGFQAWEGRMISGRAGMDFITFQITHQQNTVSYSNSSLPEHYSLFAGPPTPTST